jgi:hypothetical protein
MAAKKKVTPAKKVASPKPPASKSSSERSKSMMKNAATSKKGDLAGERAVVRQVSRINNVDRKRQKNNPGIKGVFGYTDRDEKGTLKPKWDNYIRLDGKTGRPKLPTSIDVYGKKKKGGK